MRALFWNPVQKKYLEVRDARDVEVLEQAMYLEVTGDLEDEAAFARQESGEDDDDPLVC